MLGSFQPKGLPTIKSRQCDPQTAILEQKEELLWAKSCNALLHPAYVSLDA